MHSGAPPTCLKRSKPPWVTPTIDCTANEPAETSTEVVAIMRILLINPPHTAIGSRIPREHLPPLGLLAVGGPLLDDGHEVRLLDAEFGPMSTYDIVEH